MPFCFHIILCYHGDQFALAAAPPVELGRFAIVPLMIDTGMKAGGWGLFCSNGWMARLRLCCFTRRSLEIGDGGQFFSLKGHVGF